MFGSNLTTDAFIVARTVPVLLGNLFNQRLVTTFVPVFIHLREREGEEEAWRFANSLITSLVGLFAVLALVVCLCAVPIVNVLAPGLSVEGRAIAVALLRYLSISIMLSGMCGLPRGLYFSYRSFTVPAVASLIPSAVIIAAILLLKDAVGIHAVVIGILIGTTIQASLLFLLLNAGERRLTFRLRGWHREMGEFLILLLQRFFILATHRINVTVDYMFASTLGVASISAMYYAEMVYRAPVELIRAAFGATILPVLSHHAAREDMESFGRRIRQFTVIAALLIAPVAALLIVLARPIIRAAFQGGALGEEGAGLMATALVYYSIGLLPLVISDVINVGFLSLKNTLTPLKVSCLSVFLNVGLDYVLIRELGIGGLALATSMVVAFRAILLTVLLTKQNASMGMTQSLLPLTKIVAAAIGTGLLVLVLAHGVGLFENLDRGRLEQIVWLGGISIVAGVAYLVLCRCLNISELTAAWAHVRNAMFRRKASAGDG